MQSRSRFSSRTPIETYKRYKFTSSNRQAVLVPEKRERKKLQVPYPTSSRYIRLMSTSPRRFRKYIADAATGILPCSCYSTISSRSCWSLKPPLFFFALVNLLRLRVCTLFFCDQFALHCLPHSLLARVFLHPGFRRLLPSWECSRPNPMTSVTF